MQITRTFQPHRASPQASSAKHRSAPPTSSSVIAKSITGPQSSDKEAVAKEKS
jgi:hypothetical protein